MSKPKRRMPGLRFRNGIWHIEKQIKGYGSRYESTGTGDLIEAENYLVHRLNEIREQVKFGVRPIMTFRQAATKYLEEATIKSIGRCVQALKLLDPYIGDLPIDQVHSDSLYDFIIARRNAGRRSGTVTRDLSTVRKILNLAARKWRHNLSNGRSVPWLDTAPLIEMPDWGDKKIPYPLSWEEQAKFFKLMPDHLSRMALFKVNSGAREEEVCELEWDWEDQVPELDTSVFIVPGDVVKNTENHVIVLNQVARSVIESVRGEHDKYVFTYNNNRLVEGMRNSAWIRAWNRAGLPQSEDVLKVPHNLKHTFGRRLRAAGVPYETRQVLLRHRNGDITTHYSAAELLELIRAAEKVVSEKSGKSPALTLLRRNKINRNS